MLVACLGLIVSLGILLGQASPVEAVEAEGWVPVYNGLYGGLVRALGVSPGYATDQTLFAGTWGGGVFRYHAATPPPTPVPGVSQLGLTAMAVLFLATFLWTIRQRRQHGNLHK